MPRDQVPQRGTSDSPPDREEKVRTPRDSNPGCQDTEHPVRRKCAADAEQSVRDRTVSLSAQNSPGNQSYGDSDKQQPRSGKHDKSSLVEVIGAFRPGVSGLTIVPCDLFESRTWGAVRLP